MKLKNKRMIRIISISVIAFLLVGSGILSFLQRKGKKEAMRRQSVLATEDESAYNQPDIPEITETAATTVSAADLVTPSDAVSQPVETQPTQPTEEKAVIKYVKTLKTTNIRKEDKATAGKITSVPTGSLMEYVSESSARYQVKYAGNQTGWVAKSCCEIVEKEVIIKDVPEVWWHINFIVDRWDLLTRELVNLQAVSDLIKSTPHTKYLLCGYADKQTATPEHNMMLSKNRVEAVYNALVNQFGVNPDQLVTDFKGGVDYMFYNEKELSRCCMITSIKE